MATYSTWNASDKGTHAVLSNGNLSLGNDAASQYTSARSTVGVSSGKWYWEISRTASGNLDTLYGIANSSANLNNFVGNDANGWGYFESAFKYNNNSATAYGASYGDADVIGIALDMDAGTVIFYKNNSSQGTAFTGLTGTMYAMCSNQSNSGTPTVNANFGATAFVYGPPSGYKAGLYSGTLSLTDNLVHYWKLDESSGNASDSVGSLTLLNVASAPYSAGLISNGLGVLNGTSQYVQGLSVASSSTTGISMAGWAKLSSTNQKGPFAHNGSGVLNGDGYMVGVGNGNVQTTGNHLLVYFDGVAGNDTGVNIGAAGWHFIAITRDSTTWRTYIDGTDTGVTYTTNPGTPTTNFALGYDAVNANSLWDGMLDEWGFWERELSSSEITQLYNSGAGLTYPFVAGPTNVKTFDGVTQSTGVKTYFGIALASVKNVDGIT